MLCVYHIGPCDIKAEILYIEGILLKFSLILSDQVNLVYKVPM